jgi:hypothetical protein
MGCAQAKARLRRTITKVAATGAAPVAILREVFGAEDGRDRGLAAALWRARLAGWPNVRLPLPIAAFRARGRFSQLSAIALNRSRDSLLHRA